MRLYGQVRLGQLATLSLLDARQYRSAHACTQGGHPGSSRVDPATCDAWSDPARSMLGAEQEAWLDERFARAAGEGGWTLLAQSTLFGPRDLRRGEGQSFWNDGWDGYAPARERLIGSLRKHRVANPVLLGGDLHENWVGHVRADDADGPRPNVGVEFCGTSISSRSGGNARMAELLAENPHFVFADAERKGYGLLELAPKQMSVALRVVDDVSARQSGIGTLATFAVQAGTSRIERA
jgi:alkaline phosphatase D